MKRFLIFGILGVVVLAIAGGVAFYITSQSGSSTIEQWIGSQFQSIANGYLNPKLSFDDLDYQYPGTVSLKKLRLTADDPAQPGKTIDIIGCDNATVTLAQIPSIGKPIVIEKIVLDKPLFSAVAVAPNSKQFAGFSNLLRGSSSATENPASTSQPAASAPSARPKLTEVFQMRMVKLIDGKIVYDPRIPGTEAMALDQINTQLDIQPSEGGWYKFSTAIARKPVFDLSVSGQMNLDSFSAQDLALKLLADLGQDKLDYLPPQLQKILKQYEVKGALSIAVAGALPVMDPAKGNLTTDVKLTNANITLGEYRIPVDQLDLSANLKDGRVSPTLRIEALKGSADLRGWAMLNKKMDSEIKLKITGMLLQELLASRKEGEPLKLAGKLNADAQVNAPLIVVIAKVTPRDASAPAPPLASVPLPVKWGNIRMALTEGRLVQLRTIGALSNAITTASKIATVGIIKPNSAPKDKAELNLDLAGDQAIVTDFSYSGDLIAARGRGTITLDQKLDLVVNGGPVEKVQSMFGKQVGGAINLVTDNILAYRVTGMLNQPKVTLEIAGGVGEGVGKGIGKIGEGIGSIFGGKDEKKDK